MILNIWGMVLLFSLFNCWYNGVFTSLHINVEIFVDGLFLREAYYYIYLQCQLILMVFWGQKD